MACFHVRGLAPFPSQTVIFRARRARIVVEMELGVQRLVQRLGCSPVPPL